MRTRLIFALAFIGLFLVTLYWIDSWNDHTLAGRIEHIAFPQLMITHEETSKEIKLHTVLINEKTKVTGLASSIQGLRAGQNVEIELDREARMKIALTVHVVSE